MRVLRSASGSARSASTTAGRGGGAGHDRQVLDLSLAERNLCSKVELTGKLFTGVARKPVLVVEELEILDEVLDAGD